VTAVVDRQGGDPRVLEIRSTLPDAGGQVGVDEAGEGNFLVGHRRLRAPLSGAFRRSCGTADQAATIVT
jgi:hypothetical protein